MNWRWLAVVAALLVLGAVLKGLAVPGGRTDLAPEAQVARIRWPWAPAQRVQVWFPDQSGRFWIPVWRAVAAAAPGAALAELAAGPAPGTALRPAFPPGVTLAGVAVQEGAARVDLAGPREALAGAAGQAALDAISRTLGAAGVRSVTVTLAGQPLGEPALPAAAGDVTVYYLYRGLPLPVRHPLPAGADPKTAAVRAVLAGPAPAGVDWLPGGVTLDGLAYKGDTAHVRVRFSPDLTERVEAGAWNFAPYYMAVVYTLTEFPDVRKVRFEFTGLSAAALRQCRTPLAVPLVRPDPEPARAKAGAAP